MKNDVKMNEKENLYFRLSVLASKMKLSKELGDELLEIMHEFRRIKFEGKIATTWQSILDYKKRALPEEQVLKHVVPWPKSFQMEKWAFGRLPNDIVVCSRDVVNLCGGLLVNPEIIFGYGRHINFKSYRQLSDGVPCYGSVMSCNQVNLEDAELIKRSPKGLPLPIIFNSDGVQLGKTSRQICTALASCGMFDDTLLEQNISMMCLNYIPKLSHSHEELVDHLTKKAGYNKTTAKAAIEYFEKRLIRIFWALASKPIKEFYKNGNNFSFLYTIFTSLPLGVFMRVLGLPNHAILVHPYLFSIIGDEPGIKETAGFRTGACTFFCIHCLYCNHDGMYDEDKHALRDADDIKNLCSLAEKDLSRRTGDQSIRKRTAKSKEVKAEARASKRLSALGVYPMVNAFHDVPMGTK